MNNSTLGLVAALVVAAPVVHARTMHYDTRLVCLPDKPSDTVRFVKIHLKVDKQDTKNFALSVVHHGWKGSLWDRFGQYENLDLKYDDISWVWTGSMKQKPDHKTQGILSLGKDDRLHYIEVSWKDGKKLNMGDVNPSMFPYCVEDVEEQPEVGK
jgi:hypothetical protein